MAPIRLAEVRALPVRHVAGLMTGTSMDGLDVALCKIAPGDPPACDLLAFETVPWPDALREALGREGGLGAAEIARLDMELGRFLAEALAQVLARAPLELHLIGSHGQTVYHEHAVTTLQLGEPGFLAERFRCPVVHDFRRADIVVGGAGAPLVPYFDARLLARPDRAVLAVNLGGIANFTAIPRAPFAPEQVLGMDCGPGNMILDRLAALMTDGRLQADLDGALAVRGRVRDDLLEALAGHRFFAMPPPRSAGREQFGAHYVDDLLAVARPASEQDRLDLMATATELTALAIERAYRRFVAPVLAVEEVVVSGGGTHNPELMRRIAARLAPIPVGLSDAYGLPADAKEAMAFALLASERIDERPANLPSVTGAREAVLLGRITAW